MGDIRNKLIRQKDPDPFCENDSDDDIILEDEKLKKAKYEVVNHPSHYGGDTTYEAIKVIEAWELNFNLGNTVKYLSRVGKKPNESKLTTLLKARFYLQREIDLLERR